MVVAASGALFSLLLIVGPPVPMDDTVWLDIEGRLLEPERVPGPGPICVFAGHARAPLPLPATCVGSGVQQRADGTIALGIGGLPEDRHGHVDKDGTFRVRAGSSRLRWIGAWGLTAGRRLCTSAWHPTDVVDEIVFHRGGAAPLRVPRPAGTRVADDVGYPLKVTWHLGDL
ncbi:MAG: hypothetical protein AB7T63_05855 [Planctomycetota bacterium]